MHIGSAYEPASVLAIVRGLADTVVIMTDRQTDIRLTVSFSGQAW